MLGSNKDLVRDGDNIVSTVAFLGRKRCPASDVCLLQPMSAFLLNVVNLSNLSTFNAQVIYFML